MRHVPLHALHLLRRPLILLVALVILGGGTAATWLPPFQTPGYELALLLSILVGVFGGGVGIAAGRQEARLLQGHGDRPKGVSRLDGALASTLRATFSACFLLTLCVLVPVLVALIRALITTDCNPFELFGFLPLLVLPSAWLAASVGVLLGFWLRRAWLAVLAWVVVLLLSGIHTAWPLLAGPQIYAFNHFLGYLPGPLYDEVLVIGAPLWWFRLETALLGVLAVTITSALLDVVSGTLGRPRIRPGTWAVLAAAGLAVVTLEQRAPALGLRMTDGALEQALGAVRESAHVRLVHPRGMAPEEVDRFLRDVEFRIAQLAAIFGPPPERLTLWLYRSDAEKARLVGAAQTQYAKPWRRELHLSQRAFPHPVLAHELAHLMAAPHGAGPFGVTASLFGLLPHMGIIEGIAVAASTPVMGDLTLHEWSAGMRREKLAPDLRGIVGPAGFYAQAPSRAYTLAGSFLLHLKEQHGPEKLRVLYRHGDFEAAYGSSLDALVGEWEKRLDALPLDEEVTALAFARFREGALFSRACGREVARLEREGWERRRADPETALVMFRRAATLQPGSPTYPLAEARLLRELDRPEDAGRILEALADQVRAHAALAGQVALERADLALSQGKDAQAGDLLDQVIGSAASPGVSRTAWVKQQGLLEPELRPILASYFDDPREELRLWHLERGLERHPQSAVLHYLLGRRLAQVRAAPEALPHLERALALGLPDLLRSEARRVQLEAHYLAGDCDGVRQIAGEVPDLGRAFRTEVDDWVARCAFEEQAYAGPLVPRSAFR